MTFIYQILQFDGERKHDGNFSSSKVLSLVVVVVMVMGGRNPRNVCERDNESTLIPFSSLYISYSSSKEHMLEKQGILSIMMISFILITVLQ